jgi:peptide/nickel transport system permease protein
MAAFITRRIVYMLITLVAISVMTFVIIQLPPGDFVTAMVAQLNLQGVTVEPEAMAALRARYGLDDPIYVQYWKWISNIIFAGDFGYSLEWRRPVSELLWNRLGLTFVLAFITLLFIWVVSLPIGIYSAVRKNTAGDYIVTFIGVLGLAIPNFLFALVLMYVSFRYFGTGIGGLFSPQYENAPWSWGKFVDLAQHLVIPTIVLGTSGTAALIRILRANLLDELGQAVCNDPPGPMACPSAGFC